MQASSSNDEAALARPEPDGPPPAPSSEPPDELRARVAGASIVDPASVYAVHDGAPFGVLRSGEDEYTWSGGTVRLKVVEPPESADRGGGLRDVRIDVELLDGASWSETVPMGDDCSAWNLSAFVHGERLVVERRVAGRGLWPSSPCSGLGEFSMNRRRTQVVWTYELKTGEWSTASRFDVRGRMRWASLSSESLAAIDAYTHQPYSDCGASNECMESARRVRVLKNGAMTTVYDYSEVD